MSTEKRAADSMTIKPTDAAAYSSNVDIECAKHPPTRGFDSSDDGADFSALAQPNYATEPESSGDAAVVRSIRDGPFAWASKDALRMIHEAFSETNSLPSATSVYTALFTLASDRQRERFTVNKALLAFRAGVSTRTAATILKRFEELSLIRIERQLSATGTPEGPNTYTLLRVRNGCSPVGNEQKQRFVSDKVEESKKIYERDEEEINPSLSARKREFSADVLEAIYSLYPRQEGKRAALKAIAKALDVISKRDVTDPSAWLSNRVQAYARHCRRERKDPQYIKMAQGWFNDGRFDDEPAVRPSERERDYSDTEF